MKYKEVSGWTVQELRKKKSEISENLFQIKMKNSLGQVANPLEIRVLRRDIAKIMTALNQKLAR